MSESLTSTAGELIAQKGAAAKLTYTLDYTADLGTAALTVSTWVDPSGVLTLSGSGYTNTQTSITVAGGIAGNWYVLENTATDSSGQIHTGAFRLFITDVGLVSTTAPTPFPSLLGAVASLRRDRLYSLINTYMPGQSVSDAYLVEKLLAATATISRQLRVFLVPTQMLPNTVDQSEIDTWTAQGLAVALEPAYDYDPALFQGNTWGRTLTRQRPIITLQSMAFVYPTPTSVLYQIPTDWFRIDKKYGVINLLPINTSLALPLNAFILSALGGGRTVPEFIQIRYQAGLANCARDYPDILDLIKKQAVVSIYEDLFLPGSLSQSTSADGLSQSQSLGFKIDDYVTMIDKKVETLRQSLFGIRAWSV